MSPAMIRSRVDFPQPDGPRRTTVSCSETVRFTSLSTRSVSFLLTKYSWLTCLSSMRGCVLGVSIGGSVSGHEPAAVVRKVLEPFPKDAVDGNDDDGHDDHGRGEL